MGNEDILERIKDAGLDERFIQLHKQIKRLRIWLIALSVLFAVLALVVILWR